MNRVPLFYFLVKRLVLVFILFFCLNCISEKEKKFNLDFENYNSFLIFPKNWMGSWGDYDKQVDSVVVHTGKYSAKISSNGSSGSFGAINYRIPAKYEGDSIRLEGFMKIKNIEDGYGGLLLRVDGDKNILAFDNMESEDIHGTIDWKKYSITLPFSKKAESIFVAGLMTGTGEAWFDDFVLTIDGKDVQDLKEIEKRIPKASLDKEFDTDSKIKFPELTGEVVDNLELLGRIWGFLKYHHPEIAKGNYNWDFELFRMLPKYLESTSKDTRNSILLEWINKYGEISKCMSCESTSAKAILKPDFLWINQFDLSLELINKLKLIYENRSQGEQFYIGKGSVGNPDFLNENSYYNISFKDEGFKLLALYRYWNMVQYYFPYKNLTDKDWSLVLGEYLPKIINTKNKLEYELCLIELMGNINDSHTTVSVGFTDVQSIRGKFYPPFKMKFIDKKLVVSDYFNPELKEVSKIAIGDVITHINHKPVEAVIDSVRQYYPASNATAKMRDIVSDILRSNKEEVSIDFISNNQKHKHVLPLYKISDLNIGWYDWSGDKPYKLLDGNVGYVTLKFIKKKDFPVIKELFKNTKGIIIDIRNYPSAFAPFALGSYFVSSSTPFVKFGKFNLDNPGEFTFSKSLEISKGEKELTYKGKLVVLVNEQSQSQSEYTTMAFEAGDNTTVIGSTTAGADGNVSSIYLPGGILTRFSGVGIYYPDGTETQRVGIIPNIEIKPTIKGLRKGKDEVLEKAIEIITR